MKEKIAYLCDKELSCSDGKLCGYKCSHTFDETHAKNGKHIFMINKNNFQKINTEDGIMFIEEE